MTTKVDHATEMVGRLAQQFRKPRIEAYVRVLAAEIQALEDALWDLLTLRGLAVATGATLTRIGVLVGQAREGVSDDDVFRRYVRARIATNRSRGVGDDILKIARLMVDDDGISLVLDLQGTAALQLDLVGEVVADTTADALIAFLSEAVVTGVRVILVSSLADDEDTFYTPAFSTLAGSTMAGASSLAIDPTALADLANFPATGTLVLDENTADGMGGNLQEFVRYTSFDIAGHFYLDGVTMLAHGAGASVSLADSPGQGFGVCAFVNGALAGGETTLVCHIGTVVEYPMAGTLLLDQNEIIEYTARDSTTYTLAVPVANAHDDGASVTLYVGGLTVIAADSSLTTTDDDNGEITTTIPAGRYTRERLAFEVQSRLPTDWTFTIDDATAKCTIDYPPIPAFDVVWDTIAFRDLLGFTGDLAASGPETAPHVLDESGGTAGGCLADARESALV